MHKRMTSGIYIPTSLLKCSTDINSSSPRNIQATTGYGLLKIYAVIIRMLLHVFFIEVLEFIVTQKWHICILCRHVSDCPWPSSASLASSLNWNSEKLNCCSAHVIFEYSCPGKPVLLSMSIELLVVAKSI